MKVNAVGMIAGFLATWLSASSSALCGNTLPALPPDKELSAALLAIVDDGYRIYETDHFTICYDSSFEHLRPLVGRLEGTFDAVWRFAVRTGLDTHPPERRLRVLFCNDQDDYARQGADLGIDPITVAGFYSHERDLAVFSNTLTRPTIRALTDRMERLSKRNWGNAGRRKHGKGSRERKRVVSRQLSALRLQRDWLVKKFNRLVIQHEAAHQVLFNIGVHVRRGANPPWLAEGLACQFEVPQARRDGKLTTINHMRLADFREALNVERKVKRLSDDEYAQAISRADWLPLGDLIQFAFRFRVGGTESAYRYGQAWALVFFLGRKHDKALAAYLSKLSQRKPDRFVTPERELHEFEAAFGSVPDLERTWVVYMLTLRVDWKAAGR